MNRTLIKKAIVYGLFVVLIMVLILFVSGFMWVYFHWAINHFGSLEHSAYFGDSFGAFTACLSGLSFIGVIVALILQSNELKEARIQYESMAQSQDKSQNALYEQLSQMRVASFIDGLTAFKHSATMENSNLSEAEKERLIRIGIEQSVIQMFKGSMYLEYFKPEFTYLRSELKTDGSYGVVLQNKLQPLKMYGFKSSKGICTMGKGEVKIKENYEPGIPQTSQLELSIIPDDNDSFLIHMLLKNILIEYTWSVELSGYFYKGNSKVQDFQCKVSLLDDTIIQEDV